MTSYSTFQIEDSHFGYDVKGGGVSESRRVIQSLLTYIAIFFTVLYICYFTLLYFTLFYLKIYLIISYLLTHTHGLQLA